ncbi:MAG: hypothetical protein K8E66_06015, partial [Phycisphaerales bacterium]|nr:hypothetical protein [Phycisphaerales bacterium]
VIDYSGGGGGAVERHAWDAVTTTGDGVLRVSGGELNIEGFNVVRNFEFTGGGIYGPGSLDIAVSGVWTNGNFETLSSGEEAVTVVSGAVLAISGSNNKQLRRPLVNDGIIAWTGAQIGSSGSAVVTNNGLLLVSGGSDFFGAHTFVNNGMITKITANTASIGGSFGTFANNGVVEALDGLLAINHTTITNYDDGILTGGTWRAAGGDLRISKPSIVSLEGGATIERGTQDSEVLRDNGTPALIQLQFIGDGNLILSPFVDAANTGPHLTLNGRINLGAGAVYDVQNSFTATAGGVLETEIGPESQEGSEGVTGGRLEVGGVAMMDGVLRVRLAEGFAPSVGDAFMVAMGTDIDGEFHTVETPPPPPGSQWVLEQTETEIRLIVTLVCPADLAEPFGVLDLADALSFVTAFTAMEPIADFDDNGLFDLADVLAFVNAFNAGCP